MPRGRQHESEAAALWAAGQEEAVRGCHTMVCVCVRAFMVRACVRACVSALFWCV